MTAIQQARFLTSAAKPQDFPPEAGPELAFAGRSNVGKSSAINALANRKRLAFFSRTPGRTQTINFFDLGDQGRLADLPGYGYATAPKSMRAGWDALIGGYLTGRASLVAVVVLMDARHPLTANDRHFLEWLRPVPALRLVFSGRKGNNTDINELTYVILDGTTVWYVQYTAEITEFYNLLADFESSARTFRVVK